MLTMSDDGDRTCPLCMEEMDLTDQQLKPCKCGYEICVWCWHHIIEMAEKEGSEGRCPACRTSYDKQRIVGMAANCKKMVSEMSADKKLKSQKTKSKTSIIEDRRHLSSIRVVQRNLVCIMGVPNSLADENILERKEYFGQYGKIMKVSLSRAAGTTIQQAPNSNTFSVYITYAREEEAIRCIQAVHYFVLEGKPLRACFGTTKYCYAWLRNMACSNPDCLYLHDIGSHEDSFTKDEIISAYTRSRVPQVSSTNLQPRAGNVLPPPVDDLYNNGAVSSKHSANSPLNVNASIDSSGSRSTALPAGASWGLRIANSRQPSSTTSCLQTPLKQKAEVFSSTSNAVASSTIQTSARHDDQVMTSKKPDGSFARMDSRSRPLKSLKHGDGKDNIAKVSDMCPGSTLNAGHASGSAWDDDVTTAKLPDGNHTMHMNGKSRSNETSRPSTSTSGSDDPTELVWDEARHSAWDDDTVTMSNIPSERHNSVHTNGFKSVSSEPICDLFLSPTSNVESKVLPDALCTSVVSSSGTSRKLSPLSENGGLPLSIVNTDQLFIATSKGADGGSCSSLSVSAVSSDQLYIRTTEGADGGSSSSLPDDFTHITEIVNRYADSLSAGLLSVKADSDLRIDHINMSQHLSIVSNHGGNQGSLHSRVQQSDASVTSDEHSSVKLFDGRSGVHKQVLPSSGNGLEGALAAADDHKQHVPLVLNAPSYDVCLQNISANLTNISNVDAFDKQFPSDETGRTMGAEMKSENSSFFMNGHREEIPCGFAKLKKSHQYTDNSYAKKNFGLSSCLDKLPNVEKTSTLDMEEKTIVSDMFSSDFDPWDDSWSLANNFAKLLAQMNKQEGSSNLPSTWDSQNANQSRFSFARQENQVNLCDSSDSDATHLQQLLSIKQEPYGNFFGRSLSHNNFDSSNSLGGSSLTDVTAGVSRTKISTPPGFSVPNRAPPPGFSSQGRYEQALNTHSETQLLLGNALQNQFQVHPSGDAGDVEFIDPAILAVGKGRLPLGVNNTGLGARSTFVPQFSSAEGDARIQLLMQQSVSANQDPRIPNHIGDRFMRFDDAYIPSRFPSQNSSSFSPFAQISHQQHSHILTSQWNGWNDMPIGNSMGAADALRNDMFGRGGYFHVNEEPKFHLSSTADLYNRAFGI